MTLHYGGEDGDRRQTCAPISPRIKIFVPAAYSRVVDRAIQVWGCSGRLG